MGAGAALDYDALMADTYDAQYAVVRDPSGDAAFYERLAVASGGPVLELGCGTGRVLLPIARHGLVCVGVEPSAEMLRVLRSKGPPPNLSLVQATMQQLDLGRADFAFAFVAFRAFMHLVSPEEQLAGLRNIHRHLRPGGTLALDVFEPDLARMAVTEETEQAQAPFEHDGRTVRRLVSVRRDHLRQVSDVAFRYVDDAGIELGVERVQMRWTYRYELEHLLWRAGLEPTTWSSDYRGGPYVGKGDIVVVARKG